MFDDGTQTPRPSGPVRCSIYKQFQRPYALRFHLLVDNCLFIEVKAVKVIQPINKAQLLSYLKLLDIPLGLIINFNKLKLTDSVSRLILPGANLE